MADPRAYIRDGAEIYRRSFAIIRAEADLARFTAAEERVVVRLIHACGMTEIARDVAMSVDFCSRARAALVGGAPILCDSKMVANGITRTRLPAANDDTYDARPGQALNVAAPGFLVGDTDLLHIKRSDLQTLLQKNSELCFKFMSVLCERVRWTSGLLEDASLLDLPSRLAKRLLNLAEGIGEVHKSPGRQGRISVLSSVSEHRVRGYRSERDVVVIKASKRLHRAFDPRSLVRE